MALISIQNLREWFAVTSEIKDVRLTFVIGSASRTLKSWVGAVAYADAEAGAPTNPDRAAALKEAESYLAVYHLLLNTGLRIRAAGLVKKEQDSGGATTNNVINEFLTPAELIALRKENFRMAEEITEPYRQIAWTASKSASVVISGGWAE